MSFGVSFLDGCGGDHRLQWFGFVWAFLFGFVFVCFFKIRLLLLYQRIQKISFQTGSLCQSGSTPVEKK